MPSVNFHTYWNTCESQELISVNFKITKWIDYAFDGHHSDYWARIQQGLFTHLPENPTSFETEVYKRGIIIFNWWIKTTKLAYYPVFHNNKYKFMWNVLNKQRSIPSI